MSTSSISPQTNQGLTPLGGGVPTLAGDLASADTSTRQTSSLALGSQVGPGAVLTSHKRGTIFGFAIDAKGSDGALAEGSNSYAAVETFDQRAAKVVKLVQTTTGPSDFLFNGILQGDVGLFTFEHVVGQNVVRSYFILDPVSGNKVTGNWSSPINDFGINQVADNQRVPTGVLLGHALANDDNPCLVVTNAGQNMILNVIPLNVGTGSNSITGGLVVAQDTVNNRAIVPNDSRSPSGGPPTFFVIDLISGSSRSFSGASCPGFGGCGSVGGIAYDPQTGIAAATTEVYPGVEFIDIANETSTLVKLPGQPNQINSGSFVASDPVHHLFLVAQPTSSTGNNSSIDVYDDSGTLVETLNGFNFTFENYNDPFVQISLHPTDRTGYVNGPQTDQIQRFTY